MLFRFRSLRLPLSRIPLVLALLYGATVHANDPVTDPYWEYRDEVGRGEFSYDDSQEVPWIENETQVTALPVVPPMAMSSEITRAQATRSSFSAVRR